jgi:hypothetical protein
MTTLFKPQKAGALSEVPPLTSVTKGGRRLERPARVDIQIAQYLRLDQSMLVPDIRHLESESVVFFARHFRRIDEHLYGLLFQEICRRTVHIGTGLLWSFNEARAEQIVSEVETAIVKLVLAETRSLAGEMLEVTFFRAVKRRVLNAVRNYSRTALGRRDEGGQQIEDTLKLVPDDRLGPEDDLLRMNNRDERHRVLRIACRAVTNRDHLVAVILHHSHGWPIVSQDAERPDLVRRFNATEGQIKYWIKVALQQMRAALGVEI